MTATAIVTPVPLASQEAMPASRVLRAYWMEAKYETVRMLRTPAFAIPFLGLPCMLYVLFAVVIFGAALRNDPNAGPFVLTAFIVFGAMGPGLFGFGFAVAMEREQGVIQFKRALPMPPAAYLVAKMLMAMMFGVIIVITMFAVLPLGPMRLSFGQALEVAVINVLGALPFCAVGLFIGTRTTSRSAPAFVNIVYQLMMHTSGLFYPLPKLLKTVAPIWPSYHLQQLTLSAVGGRGEGSAVVHVLVLAGVTLLLTAIAVRRLARVG